MSTRIHESVAGMCMVEVRFIGDNGEKDVRPPTSSLVEDKGGTVIVQRAGYMKMRDELPDSETEVRELLTRAIDEP